MEDMEKQNSEPQINDELIDIGYFSKVKLKVATILNAERVADTDKLMKLTIDIGSEQRTLVAGIALSYAPEDLPGKQIIVIANLKPAKLRGITSQGMLLAAKDENGLSLLTVDSPVAAGSGIS
ncbi:MAG: methionine--tRNA ligase subunit beta [Candidatus Auribacterota bacterium]|jgi:methionyl-tRNA synthetase|nr:methionine--tRNA ligase subunit beta [Candidatus Auribacterota bacterium]